MTHRWRDNPAPNARGPPTSALHRVFRSRNRSHRPGCHSPWMHISSVPITIASPWPCLLTRMSRLLTPAVMPCGRRKRRCACVKRAAGIRDTLVGKKRWRSVVCLHATLSMAATWTATMPHALDPQWLLRSSACPLEVHRTISNMADLLTPTTTRLDPYTIRLADCQPHRFHRHRRCRLRRPQDHIHPCSVEDTRNIQQAWLPPTAPRRTTETIRQRLHPCLCVLHQRFLVPTTTALMIPHACTTITVLLPLQSILAMMPMIHETDLRSADLRRPRRGYWRLAIQITTAVVHTLRVIHLYNGVLVHLALTGRPTFLLCDVDTNLIRTLEMKCRHLRDTLAGLGSHLRIVKGPDYHHFRQPLL